MMNTTMKQRTWLIAAYDENLVAAGKKTAVGTHGDAVMAAEWFIGNEPQWSYQITEVDEAQAERQAEYEQYEEDRYNGLVD